jgi:hypothetical protein
MCSTLLIKTLTNLKRHLKGIHPNIFAKLQSEKVPVVDVLKQVKASQLKVTMSKRTLIRKCTGLVIENHLPFSILDTDNFKAIVNPHFDAIAAKDGEKKLRMNSQNVKEIVKAAAESE